jgi:hypothetical protein
LSNFSIDPHESNRFEMVRAARYLKGSLKSYAKMATPR